MDLMKLRQALAMLNAFASSLPKGDIEEKYVALYHKTLNDIRAQTNQDFSYFLIPEEELKYKVSYIHSLTEATQTVYSEKRYCDRERFLMALRGAINFINSCTQDMGATTLPLVDPPK